MLPGDA
jgi:hypothetical protein